MVSTRKVAFEKPVTSGLNWMPNWTEDPGLSETGRPGVATVVKPDFASTTPMLVMEVDEVPIGFGG